MQGKFESCPRPDNIFKEINRQYIATPPPDKYDLGSVFKANKRRMPEAELFFKSVNRKKSNIMINSM